MKDLSRTAAVWTAAAFGILSAAAVSANPDIPRALKPDPLAQARTLFDQKQYADVIRNLQEPDLQKLPRQDLRRAYDLLGLSYQFNNEQDRAIGVYELAEQLFPKDINLLTHLADLLHGLEIDDRARPLYERVLAIHPNNAAANLGMAEIERVTGLLDQSQEHYERCLIELKDNPAVWRGYAEVLAERRNFPQAAAAIQKALNLNPNNPSSLRSLAQFQRRQDLTAQAYATMDKAIAAAPAANGSTTPKSEMTLQRGLWLLEDDRLEESLAAAQSVLRHDPRDPLALWLRASIQLRRGRREEAERDLRLVAEMTRETPFLALTARTTLQELVRNP